MINFFDVFITITTVKTRTLWISICGMKFTAIMTDGAFSYHHAYSSLHKISPLFFFDWYPARAGVLLLLSKVTQKHF
jgi:hypothetical protein